MSPQCDEQRGSRLCAAAQGLPYVLLTSRKHGAICRCQIAVVKRERASWLSALYSGHSIVLTTTVVICVLFTCLTLFCMKTTCSGIALRFVLKPSALINADKYKRHGLSGRRFVPRRKRAASIKVVNARMFSGEEVHSVALKGPYRLIEY